MNPQICPVCNGNHSARTTTVRDYADPGVSFSLSQCALCEVAFLTVPPPDALLRERSAEYQATMKAILEDLRNTVVGRFAIRVLRNGRTPPGIPRGRLLDIGCSSGEYLARLNGLGWDVSGIEYDPDAARHAREVLKLDVRTGRAEEALPSYPPASFDLVTMWHVLEHLQDPALVLSEVRRVLKPGGRLIAEVPNYGSAWRWLLRDCWFPLEYPYHRFHFTPRALTRLLESAGFQQCRMWCEPAPAETTWSFHMLWLRMRRRRWNRRLLWTPSGVIALYPLELLLALLGRSNHIRAVAERT